MRSEAMNEYIVEVKHTYVMTVIADNAGEAQVLALREMPILTKEDGVTLVNLQLGKVIAIPLPEEQS
jgi:hypothetical protein